MGGTRAVFRKSECRDTRHRLVSDCSNLAGAGGRSARFDSRCRRLCQLVVRCRLEGIYRRRQTRGVRADASLAILDPGAESERRGALHPESLRAEARHGRAKTPTGPRKARPDDRLRTSSRRMSRPSRVCPAQVRHDESFPVISVKRAGACGADHLGGYSETVCTTLPTGRELVTGSLMSLTSASSYSCNVCSGALAFICTTL